MTALDGLDLAVPAGQVCALLGPNGAGKTTAVRILATLTRPDAGRAIIAGHDVARQPGRVRASIGLVGQHAAVDDDLTGQENLVIIGLMLHLGRRAARQRAAALLAEFELAEAGGRGLARGGTTVLLSTQYLAEADEIADPVVIIDGGRVVAHGSPDELKDEIGTRVDIILADAGDLGAAAAVLSRWATAAPSEDPDRRRLTAPVPAGAVSLPELVRQLDTAGLQAEDVSVRRPTLDEVFLDRTGHARPAGAAAHAAVPFGQAAATSVYGLISFILMALCGLVVGWRIDRGPADAVAALLLLLAFQFAATWVGLYLGLVIGKEETAAQASILVFPVTMVSNVFVPTSGMPGWMRLIAGWNPISALAAAARQLLGSPTTPANGAWPLEHPVVASLAWTALLLAVFVPLCTRRYARSPF